MSPILWMIPKQNYVLFDAVLTGVIDDIYVSMKQALKPITVLSDKGKI